MLSYVLVRFFRYILNRWTRFFFGFVPYLPLTVFAGTLTHWNMLLFSAALSVLATQLRPMKMHVKYTTWTKLQNKHDKNGGFSSVKKKLRTECGMVLCFCRYCCGCWWMCVCVFVVLLWKLKLWVKCVRNIHTTGQWCQMVWAYSILFKVFMKKTIICSCSTRSSTVCWWSFRAISVFHHFI